MSAPMFNPEAFLDLPIEAPLVKRPPLPAGDYTSQIKEVQVRPWQSKDKYDEATGQLKSGIAYDIIHTVEVPEAARALVGLTQPTIELKDSIMLEMTSTGSIDTAPGKNGSLRRYREAVDMNKPGEVFSARKMQGKLLLVRIAHREYPAGSGDLFEEIKGVAKLG